MYLIIGIVQYRYKRTFLGQQTEYIISFECGLLIAKFSLNKQHISNNYPGYYQIILPKQKKSVLTPT